MIKLRRFYIIIVLTIYISSCQTILKTAFNIHDASFYSSRVNADEINKNILARFEINSVMLYRTNEYIKTTGDTLYYSGEISFYNEFGKEYINSEYCSKTNYKAIDSKALKSNSFPIDTILRIQDRLMGLEYFSGEPYKFNHSNKIKYSVVMDWNTFWQGPEKKRLKKVIKSFPKDSTLIIFINKDYILEDSLFIHSAYLKHID